MSAKKDSFGVLDTLTVGTASYRYYNLPTLAQKTGLDLARMPVSIRVLLENALRNEDGRLVTRDAIESLMGYDSRNVVPREIPYMPARVVLQDFTGVPAVVDLAAMRDAMRDFKGDPARINPIVRADLVIDHSVQVDAFGMEEAYLINTEKEFDDQYVLKMFFFIWVDGYLWYWFLGFVHIPFVLYNSDETGKLHADVAEQTMLGVHFFTANTTVAE